MIRRSRLLSVLRVGCFIGAGGISAYIHFFSIADPSSILVGSRIACLTIAFALTIPVVASVWIGYFRALGGRNTVEEISHEVPAWARKLLVLEASLIRRTFFTLKKLLRSRKD